MLKNNSKKNSKKKSVKSNLEVLFDIVLDKSYKLRKANPTTFDGQGFWQPIKQILEPLDKYYAPKWKKISKAITEKIMLLPEFTINGYGNKVIIENNHFIIQQVRIPIKEKATIKKIVQIALNIGQYQGTNNNNFYNGVRFNDVNQFLHKNDIIALSKYITIDIISSINRYLHSL